MARPVILNLYKPFSRLCLPLVLCAVLFMPTPNAPLNAQDQYAQEQYAQESGRPFDELPLKPDLPENLLMETPKVPPTRKKNARYPIRADLNLEAIKNYLSGDLSNACVHRHFNQFRLGRYYVILNDYAGTPRRVGAASIHDGNIYDPDGYAEPEILYLFIKDWSSACRVYTLPYFEP